MSALRDDYAPLAKECPCLIDELRPVLNQQLTPGKKMVYILLPNGLGANEARTGMHERFADGLGVGGIGLIAGAEKRLDPLGIDEFYGMTKRRKRPCPMVCRATGFNAHDRLRQLREISCHGVTTQLPVGNFPPFSVSGKSLKNILGYIQSDKV